MAKTQTIPIGKILNEARFYPSPHNSQPIKVRVIGSDSVGVYYNLDRGLPAESFGIQFAYVCCGVFLASLRTVARHYGYTTEEHLQLTEMDFKSSDRNHLMGHVRFVSFTPTPESEESYQCYLKRQTSRIPYDNRLIDDEATARAVLMARDYGQTLHVANDPRLVASIIDINQRTLFLDLENDAVHRELMQWLRFSEAEARAKADGLSARTMLVNGRLLHFAVKHRGLWRLPLIGKLVKTIYLNTMRGVRQVAWLTGPFNNFEDFVKAGQCFMEIWILLTRYNVRLHPYGTVITNARSHKAFVELVGEKEAGGQIAWMLFRLGYSDKPPISYRRELKEMLLED